MGRIWVHGFSLCAGFLALACGSSKDEAAGSNAAWRESANQVNDATCDKTYQCFSATTLGLLRQMEPRIGQSVEECKANYRAANAKATQPCKPGETFHQDAADQCVSGLGAMTCGEFLASPNGPPSCSQICSSGSQTVPACAEPSTEPPTIDLPDGGTLPMFQTATGEISSGETDVFTIPLDCAPGYGFQVTVNPLANDLDIALSYDVAGYHSDDNQFGPGTGEGSTLVAGSHLALPGELTVGVSAVGGTTGKYQISVTSNP